jgi:hypothetical protein
MNIVNFVKLSKIGVKEAKFSNFEKDYPKAVHTINLLIKVKFRFLSKSGSDFTKEIFKKRSDKFLPIFFFRNKKVTKLTKFATFRISAKKLKILYIIGLFVAQSFLCILSYIFSTK